jgi:hypothetical protein
MSFSRANCWGDLGGKTYNFAYSIGIDGKLDLQPATVNFNSATWYRYSTNTSSMLLFNLLKMKFSPNNFYWGRPDRKVDFFSRAKYEIITELKFLSLKFEKFRHNNFAKFRENSQINVTQYRCAYFPRRLTTIINKKLWLNAL